MNPVPGGGLVGIGAFTLSFLVRALVLEALESIGCCCRIDCALTDCVCACCLSVLRRQSVGFEEFQSLVQPLLESSRRVHEQFANVSVPSVLMVPAKIIDPNERERRFAYFAADDPMTLYVLAPEASDAKTKATTTTTATEDEDTHSSIA